MKKKILLIVFFSAAFFVRQVSFAQIPNCDASVPVFNIDFSSITQDSTWISASVVRNGNCCSTLPPDRCILFNITTGTSTVGITLGNWNCQPPPGSLFFQLDCGPPLTYGDTVFISTPGIHYITFCKPGNLPCYYTVTALLQQLPTSINETGFIQLEDIHSLLFNLTSSSSCIVTIFSADGKKVSEKNYSLDAGQHQISLSTQNLRQGIYFVRLAGDNNFQTKSFKFIK